MQAIETLMEEHRVIEQALEVLETIADRCEGGAPLPVEDIGHLLDFFREFADRCHHFKEEKVLFEWMAGRGFPKEDGPIAVMLHEHETGRSLIGQMAAAAQQGDTGAFVRAARNYITLLRQHIFKEDNILFPMAEQHMTPSDNDTLLSQYRQHEQQEMGTGTHQHWLSVVGRLRERWL